MKRTITILLFQLIFAFSVKAGNEVEIKTSAIGKNKEDAIRVALRSAIEQVSGAYLTSSSTIINDELISENIESISNGNIKSYKINGEYLIDQSNYSVSITAMVSLNKIIEYCQQKGHSEVKVNGSLFANNVKNIEMNHKATLKVIENMFKALNLDDNIFYNYDIKIGQLKIGGFNCVIDINTNKKNYKEFSNYIVNTLKGISLNNNQLREFKSIGYPTETFVLAYNNSKIFKCILYEGCKEILETNLNKFSAMRTKAFLDFGYERLPMLKSIKIGKYMIEEIFTNHFYTLSGYGLPESTHRKMMGWAGDVFPLANSRKFVKKFYRNDWIIDLSTPISLELKFFYNINLENIKKINEIKIYPIRRN